MEQTPSGTSVGVDDPYEHVDRCDHCTDEGTCRFAFERFEADPAFARERRDDGYRCPVVNPEAKTTADTETGADADDDWDEWTDCPNFASTTEGRQCRRCGLEERRLAHDDARPLLEEHHLSYAGGEAANDPTSEAATDATDEPRSGAATARKPSGGVDPLSDGLDLADGERIDADETGAAGNDAGENGASGNGAGADERAGNDATEIEAGRAGADGTDATEESRGASGDDRPPHEITVALCRWCHAKVHRSWARVDDDVEPDPEAIAAREQRRGRELEEASFQTAAERFDGGE